jgi:hypothetical protein
LRKLSARKLSARKKTETEENDREDIHLPLPGKRHASSSTVLQSPHQDEHPCEYHWHAAARSAQAPDELAQNMCLRCTKRILHFSLKFNPIQFKVRVHQGSLPNFDTSWALTDSLIANANYRVREHSPTPRFEIAQQHSI